MNDVIDSADAAAPSGDNGKYVEFVLDEETYVSSAVLQRAEGPNTPEIVDDPAQESPSMPSSAAEAGSPVFDLLSAPKLPQLSRANRARLLVQSPNRLYFYWSVGENPFRTLSRALGGRTGSYSLVVKLVSIDQGTERIDPVESDGSTWFDVDADRRYRAEIGFFAVNRPFVRILTSNLVETPRKSPSPRPDSDSEWAVSADLFARVLGDSGFARDAFDVALAGDDGISSENATRAAFSRFSGYEAEAFDSERASDIRFAMFALASGATLDSLRHRVDHSLLELLSASAENLSGERAIDALRDEFEFEEVPDESADPLPTVFGASLIHFPKKLRRRLALDVFAPVSSIAA